jgi:hypothetical protein
VKRKGPWPEFTAQVPQFQSITQATSGTRRGCPGPAPDRAMNAEGRMENADPPSLRYGTASGHRFWARAKPPKATSMRHQCDIKATSMRVESQAVGTPKPPQCDPQATTRHGKRRRTTEGGGQRTEDRRQRSEGGGGVHPLQYRYGGRECRMQNAISWLLRVHDGRLARRLVEWRCWTFTAWLETA